jgi:hypothetical protein
VNTVKIDFDKKQATVTMKKGQLTKKGVTKALGGAGFGVNGFSGGRPEAWLIHVTGMQ